MKDIVKHDNDFNLAKLHHLTQIEMNVFAFICSQFTSHRETTLEIPYDEIKRGADILRYKYSNKQFKELMIRIQEKIVKTSFSVKVDSKLIQAPLFRYFITDDKIPDYVFVSLNDIFHRYFFDIPQGFSFSEYELRSLLGLKSKYAQILFRLLLQNYKGEWNVDFSEFKNMMGFKPSYRTGYILARLKEIVKDINNSHSINNLSFAVNKNTKKRGTPIESITFYYKIIKPKRQEIMEQSYTIEEKVHKETVITPSNNPLYDSKIEQVQHIERIEHKETCPRCGGQVFTSVVKSGSNQGRQYKVCENSKYYRGNPNTACNYYEWIDDEPPIEQDTVITSPEPATINFNSSGLTNELNVTPITGHTEYKPVAAPPEFTAKLQKLRGQQSPPELEEPIDPKESRKKELLEIIYDYSKIGIILGKHQSDPLYKELYFELMNLLDQKERYAVIDDILDNAKEYYQNK